MTDERTCFARSIVFAVVDFPKYGQRSDSPYAQPMSGHILTSSLLQDNEYPHNP